MGKTEKTAQKPPQALERDFLAHWLDNKYALQPELTDSDLIWLENAAAWFEINGPREYAEKARGIMENNDLF